MKRNNVYIFSTINVILCVTSVTKDMPFKNTQSRPSVLLVRSIVQIR